MTAVTIPDGVVLLEPRDVYDKAIIGFTDDPKDHWDRTTKTVVAVYSIERVIDALMQEEGWDFEESMSWFYYNIEGSWIGEGTPTFMSEQDDDVH